MMPTNTSATGGYLTPSSTLPPNDDALEDILTELVAGVTGLDRNLVRPRFQTKPPKLPSVSTDWAAVGISDNDADFDAVVTHDGTGNGETTLSRNERFEVMVSFYGPNAEGYAKLFRDGLEIPQNREEINKYSINFVSVGTLRNVPEQVNNVWYKRRDLPVYFNRGETRTYAIENIAIADIEIHTDNVVNVIHVE